MKINICDLGITMHNAINSIKHNSGLIIIFVIGIIWYSLYKKDNNLLGVILSHIVLGIVD